MSNSTIIEKKPLDYSLIKWFMIILLVWAIPSGLLWTGIYLFIREECDRKDNQRLYELDSKIEALSYDCSATRFFQNKFSKFFNSLRGLQTNSVSNTQKLLDGFTRRFPEGMLEIYLFNSNQEIIKTKGARKEYEQFMKIATSGYEKGPITDANTKEIGLLIPEPTLILKRIRAQSDRAIELGNPDRYSLCYFNLDDQQHNDQTIAGILIFVHYNKLKSSVIMTESLMGQEENYGYVDPREYKLPKLFEGTAISSEQIRDYFTQYPTNRFRRDGKLVCLNKINNDCILVGALPITQPAWHYYIILFILFLAFSCYFFKFTYQIYVRHINLGFNMRKRLTWLFVLCYIFPLAAASILASQYLMELKDSLLTTEEFNNYKRLSEIDSGFSRFITSKLMEYRKFNSMLTEYAVNPVVIKDKLKEQVLNNQLDSVHLLASDTTVLLSSELYPSEVRRHSDKSYEEQQEVLNSWVLRHAVLTPSHLTYLFNRSSANSFPEEKYRTEGHKAFLTVFKSTAAAALDYYNQSHNLPVVVNRSGANLVFEAVMEAHAQTLFQAIKTNISKFTPVEGINESVYFYCDIIPGPSGEAWYAYVTLSNLDNLERQYLNEIFHDIKIRNKQINRVFPEEDIRAISTHPYATCFPSVMEFRNFESVLKQSTNDSKTFTHKMVLNNENVYVSVLRGSYLKQYLLLQIFPESKIEEIYKKQVNTVVILFIVIMVMGLALARLMTRTLVLPITDIINGVKSIAGKNYDCQIKVRSSNEFGVMADAFNKTAVSLKELDISSKLDSFLFPEKEFRCGSYLIYASHLNSKVVASDFYDYIQLKQGNFAIIIAKITGNDVISAHLMAMMKTSFITLMSAFPKSPEFVMAKLNAIFQPYTDDNHVINCFIGILDPTNDSIICTNAGQTYPITVNPKSGEKEFVSLPSTSLGINVNTKFAKHEISLKRKVLVLYSHGATDATNKTGEELGKDAFMELVSQAISSENKNPAEAILNKVNDSTINVPWREDISVLTIQNRI